MEYFRRISWMDPLPGSAILRGFPASARCFAHAKKPRPVMCRGICGHDHTRAFEVGCHDDLGLIAFVNGGNDRGVPDNRELDRIGRCQLHQGSAELRGDQFYLGDRLSVHDQVSDLGTALPSDPVA